MQLIVVPRHAAKPCRVRVEIGPLLLPAAMLLLALFALSLGLGYRLGHATVQTVQTEVLAQLASQHQEIETARAEAEAELELLSQRMAMAHAQLTRLDALGQRVVQVAELDAAEFDFRTDPALGGPEPLEELEFTRHPLLGQLDTLLASLDSRYRQLSTLEALLHSRQLLDETRPAGEPLRTGWISSGYGNRRDPFTGKPDFHAGIDFAAPKGTEIHAVASGVVTQSAYRPDYGYLVDINHGNGYVTRYAHNSRNLVRVGDAVSRGEVIGLVGSTGRSTGPHLHFEVIYNDRRVNPIRFIRAAEPGSGR